MCVCVYVCMYYCVRIQTPYVGRILINVCMCMYVCVRVHVCICVYGYILVNVYVCECKGAHVRMYMGAYTQTQTYQGVTYLPAKCLRNLSVSAMQLGPFTGAF